MAVTQHHEMWPCEKMRSLGKTKWLRCYHVELYTFLDLANNCFIKSFPTIYSLNTSSLLICYWRLWSSVVVNSRRLCWVPFLPLPRPSAATQVSLNAVWFALSCSSRRSVESTGGRPGTVRDVERRRAEQRPQEEGERPRPFRKGRVRDVDVYPGSAGRRTDTPLGGRGGWVGTR